MDERNEQHQHGLPWPEAYAALRPLICAEWAIDDELYLTRQLSGGKSGAMVYLADVTGGDFSGQAILKLDRAADPTWQEKTEAERHTLAYETEPKFSKEHLPRVLHTMHDGDGLAILSTIAGRGLEFAVPWSECKHDRQLAIAKMLSRDLLEDWNRGAKLAPGLLSPETLLRGWLGYRLDPEQGRLYNFLNECCGISAEEPSLSFEGTWYPNPLAFAVSASKLPDQLRLRAIKGNSHGDLHGLNVLVSSAGGELDRFYLIDLALYENRQFLFYDHGYFALSYLLARRGEADAAHWHSILDELCPHNFNTKSGGGLHGDDIGLIDLLKVWRQEVFDWVDRHHPNRLSYMESQFQLAQVAAGLNFANKQIPDRQRRMAFLFAASVLKDYLGLHSVDWPKHGPAITLDGQPSIVAKPTATATSVSSMSEESGDTLPLPEKPSIAVLAFNNQSGDPEQEFFTDGVTDEIIIELSRVDWLMVISRGSTFSYKGQSVSAKRIGKELGVHYVVEGVVRKTAERVRVTAQLVDAQAGEQLWAERYDRNLDDIFELQEEIAAAIVASIDSKLKETEREQAKRKTGQVSIWENFQKAMWHVYKFTQEDSDLAKAQLVTLSDKAPDFSGVQAILALLQVRQFYMGNPEGREELLKTAYGYATRAVELDDGSSLAHLSLSRVYAFQGKYDQAVDEAETCIALNPSSSNGFLNLAATLLWGERAEEALSAIDKSIRLSPKGPFFRLKKLLKGLIYYFLDDYGEAERLIRQSEASPILAPFSHLLVSAVLVRKGQIDDARRAIAEARSLRPELAGGRLRAAWRTMAPHYRDKLLGDLERAGLPD